KVDGRELRTPGQRAELLFVPMPQGLSDRARDDGAVMTAENVAPALAYLPRLVAVAGDDADRAARRAGVRVVEAQDERDTRLIFRAGELVWGPRGTFAPN